MHSHNATPPKGPQSAQGQPRLVVGIATVGRPDILSRTLSYLSVQERLPDLLVLSVADMCDVAGESLPDLPFAADIAIGSKGLPHQRNRILERAGPQDILLFLDDDFLMAPDYLGQLERVFADAPDVAMVTGNVLADGVVGPGLSYEDGVAILSQSAGIASRELTSVYNGYGCNMALRVGPALTHGLRFDETLPAYAWLEDVDFSRQLAPYGRIVKAVALRGVHLGTKTSRTPGLKLGYSQIANPIYLSRKGTMASRRALKLMARNVTSNVVFSLRPRPWTDSRGRLRGNLRALGDVLRGRAHPARIQDL